MNSLFEEALANFQSGQHGKAEALYTKYIECCQTEAASEPLTDSARARLAEAYNNRGQIKYLRVDFDEAIEDYTSALRNDENFATALYNRGQIHYRLARFQEGIHDFQKALKCRPDFPDAVIALQTAQEDAIRASHNVATENTSK